MSLIDENTNNEAGALINSNILEEEKENGNSNLKETLQHITPEMVLALPSITQSK